MDFTGKKAEWKVSLSLRLTTHNLVNINILWYNIFDIITVTITYKEQENIIKYMMKHLSTNNIFIFTFIICSI